MFIRALLIIGVILAGALLVGSPALTQDDAGACPALVQRALDELGDNCSVLDRNSACYGFNRVDATFTQVMASGFFSEPADRAGLENFARIATVPLDTARDFWGIALLNVQANVPGSLPGQAVVFLMMGDTEVENAVEPENMYVPVEPVVVKVLANTDLHSSPDTAANLVASAAAGQTLQADGLNADETWVRVVTAFGPAWINRAALDPLLDLTGLPLVNEDSRTPMQAFYFRTAFTDLECSQAPSLLALQSPRGIKVDLTANGANIRMGSRAILRVMPPGDILEIITVEGTVTLEPGTPNERVIPAGAKVFATLDEDGNVVLTSFTTPERISSEDMELIETVNQAYTRLGLTEDEDAPAEPTVPVTVIDTNACVAGQQIVHTVTPGDTLFQLALTYNTSVDAIRQANGVQGALIASGQQLVITCGATVPPTLPAPNTPPAPTSPAPSVDCGPFRATSPLDGLPYGTGTFYWDAAPGADGYRVVISGEAGTAVFSASGGQTSVSADLSNSGIGYGFSFSWYVEALRGGAVVCSTPPVRLFREAPPPGDPPAPPPPVDRPVNPPPPVTDEPPPPVTQEPTPPPTTQEPTPPPSTEEPTPPPPNALRPLALASMCSAQPEEFRSWRVHNPNPTSVPVRWVVNQSDQSGSYSAPPGNTFFTTIAVPGDNTTTLYWVDENGVQQQDAQASSEARCGPDGTP